MPEGRNFVHDTVLCVTINSRWEGSNARICLWDWIISNRIRMLSDDLCKAFACNDAFHYSRIEWKYFCSGEGDLVHMAANVYIPVPELQRLQLRNIEYKYRVVKENSKSTLKCLDHFSNESHYLSIPGSFIQSRREYRPSTSLLRYVSCLQSLRSFQENYRWVTGHENKTTSFFYLHLSMCVKSSRNGVTPI